MGSRFTEDKGILEISIVAESGGMFASDRTEAWDCWRCVDDVSANKDKNSSHLVRQIFDSPDAPHTDLTLV